MSAPFDRHLYLSDAFLQRNIHCSFSRLIRLGETDDGPVGHEVAATVSTPDSFPIPAV